MKVLVVEDDYLQADWIQRNLERALPGITIYYINTELEFRSRLDYIAGATPDVIVMDIMLRWANPDPNLQLPPEEVKEGGFYRAGLRCQKLLANDERTKDIPVIFYTVLEPYDLESELQQLSGNITYLRKESDLTSLIYRIRDLTQRGKQ